MRHWGQCSAGVVAGQRVYVLLFDAGSDQEGIHSLELSGRTVVLLFEEHDDAERYAGLLEAQDFPVPTVESLDRDDMELFCEQSGYEGRFVPKGFLPQTAEERLLIAPPSATWTPASGATRRRLKSGATPNSRHSGAVSRVCCDLP